MLPFLFTTLKRRLGTEDTKWWSVSGVILSHSSCKQVLRWATVRGLRCRILRFKMRHTFSIGDRSGLQAGQSSTRTLFLRSQDFVMCAECGFALSCWNMHGRPWKRCLLEVSILCSKISMYFSALMVPSQKCKLPLPRALTQPHTMCDESVASPLIISISPSLIRRPSPGSRREWVCERGGALKQPGLAACDEAHTWSEWSLITAAVICRVRLSSGDRSPPRACTLVSSWVQEGCVEGAAAAPVHGWRARMPGRIIPGGAVARRRTKPLQEAAAPRAPDPRGERVRPPDSAPYLDPSFQNTAPPSQPAQHNEDTRGLIYKACIRSDLILECAYA